MFLKVDVADSHTSAFPSGPRIRSKPDLAESSGSFDDWRFFRSCHDHDLKGPQVAFDVQSQRFPVVSKLVEFHEMQEILRGNTIGSVRQSAHRNSQKPVYRNPWMHMVENLTDSSGKVYRRAVYTSRCRPLTLPRAQYNAILHIQEMKEAT